MLIASRTENDVKISEAIDKGLYQCKSDLQETAIRNIGKTGGVVTIGLDQNRDEYLKLREGNHVAFMNEFGIKIYRTAGEDKEKISYDELKTENRAMAVKLTNIAKTYKRIQQDKLQTFAEFTKEDGKTAKRKTSICNEPLEERIKRNERNERNEEKRQERKELSER